MGTFHKIDVHVPLLSGSSTFYSILNFQGLFKIKHLINFFSNLCEPISFTVNHLILVASKFDNFKRHIGMV